MAVATGKTRCVKCDKEKTTSKCSGCLEDFCFNHLVQHRQQLGEKLDELENERDVFRQTLTEQQKNPEKHLLIQQINQWEKDSIEKIQQTAEETRQLIVKHTNGYNEKIEINLDKLTKELKEIRQENDFNEIILNELKLKLEELEEQLVKPQNISIEQDSSSFIKKISVVISSGCAREMADSQAARKQAEGAHRHLEGLLTNGPKKIDPREIVASPGNPPRYIDPKEHDIEIEKYKQEATKAREDFDTLREQYDNAVQEYDKLNEEHRKLQMKLAISSGNESSKDK